jgi:hypothetical protein
MICSFMGIFLGFHAKVQRGKGRKESLRLKEGKWQIKMPNDLLFMGICLGFHAKVQRGQREFEIEGGANGGQRCPMICR